MAGQSASTRQEKAVVLGEDSVEAAALAEVQEADSVGGEVVDTAAVREAMAAVEEKEAMVTDQATDPRVVRVGEVAVSTDLAVGAAADTQEVEEEEEATEKTEARAADTSDHLTVKDTNKASSPSPMYQDHHFSPAVFQRWLLQMKKKNVHVLYADLSFVVMLY